MNTVEMTIKRAGWGRRKAMKKQIDLFESSLMTFAQLFACPYKNILEFS